MSPESIRWEIQRCRSRLQEAQSNKWSAQARLDAARGFAQKRQAVATAMEQDLVARRTHLTNTTIDPTRVKVVQGFTQAMTGLLDDGNAHLSRLAEQIWRIGRLVAALESQVDQYAWDEQRYTAALADLRRQLIIAEAQGV